MFFVRAYVPLPQKYVHDPLWGGGEAGWETLA